MIVDKYGRVAGSIDLATLAQMYAETGDDELRTHYREVAAESGVEFGETAEEPEVEPEAEPRSEEELEPDVDELRAQAEELGIKVDGRWGVDRLHAEIDAASEE